MSNVTKGPWEAPNVKTQSDAFQTLHQAPFPLPHESMDEFMLRYKNWFRGKRRIALGKESKAA